MTIDDPDNLAKTLSPAILSEFDAFVFVPDVALSAHKAEVINLISASNKPAIYAMSDPSKVEDSCHSARTFSMLNVT
jgi:hypothetical protein